MSNTFVNVRGKKLAMPSVKAQMRAEALEIANAQKMTVRCVLCGWYKRNILVGDGKRAFAEHRCEKRQRKGGPRRG